jgi:hypothetical protein
VGEYFPTCLAINIFPRTMSLTVFTHPESADYSAYLKLILNTSDIQRIPVITHKEV